MKMQMRKQCTRPSAFQSAIRNPQSAIHDSSRSGFTLIEVLVALAIFVGSAAALSRLVLIGIENAEFSQWNAQAWSLIESRFEELSAGILTLDSVGTITMEEAPGWQCNMSSDAADINGLYRVTIEMRNVSGKRAEGFVVRGTRYFFDESSVQTDSSSSSSSTGSTGSTAGTGSGGAGS